MYAGVALNAFMKSMQTLYGDFNTYLYFIEVLSLIKIQQTPLFQFKLILANINLSSTPSFFWCYAHPSSVHLRSGDKMVLQQVISVSSSSPQVLWSYSGDFPPFKSAWGCSSLLVKYYSKDTDFYFFYQQIID